MVEEKWCNHNKTLIERKKGKKGGKKGGKKRKEKKKTFSSASSVQRIYIALSRAHTWQNHECHGQQLLDYILGRETNLLLKSGCPSFYLLADFLCPCPQGTVLRGTLEITDHKDLFHYISPFLSRAGIFLREPGGFQRSNDSLACSVKLYTSPCFWGLGLFWWLNSCDLPTFTSFWKTLLSLANARNCSTIF